MCFSDTKDRIVIVSNFTQTLGLVAQLCSERNYPYVTLDGAEAHASTAPCALWKRRWRMSRAAP